MPPSAPLPGPAVDDLERWIRDGARWPVRGAPLRAATHWAFEPVRASGPPEVPAVPTDHPIDAFLAVEQRSGA